MVLIPHEPQERVFARANRDVGLAFGQIEEPVADHQFDPQAGMERVKRVDERYPPEAICQDRSAGYANGAGETLVGRREMALERRHRRFDALGRGPQFLSKLGQSVAREVALDQPAAEALLPMSGDGNRSVAAWPKRPRPSSTLPSRQFAHRAETAGSFSRLRGHCCRPPGLASAQELTLQRLWVHARP
jgi:hypothetical protein